MVLQIKLFGHLQVTHNTAPLAPALRPRAQWLLAYLLLHRAPVQTNPPSRESIAFSLWPDRPEPEALGALRRALSDLRRGLPGAAQAEWIVAARDELRWNPQAPFWLDVDAFQQFTARGTPDALHSAIGLYSGDLLAGWDAGWLRTARERLREAQLNALRQLSTHHRALGEHALALDLARRALALDPLVEATWREVIALHYAAGDRAAALAEYERLRERLREELDVEPMAETLALAEAIARGAPPPAPAVRPMPADPAGVAETGLVGREAELARLDSCWTRAAGGQGGVAIISGEAGVGKSRLALALSSQAARRGGRTLVGHCYEFEAALPYQALVEMLRAAGPDLRRLDLARRHRSVLAHLAPDVIGEADPAAAGGPVATDDLRAQLFEAMLQAFLALAQAQPVLLLIEDVHWAAESTVDWLTYIAPRLSASRLMVIVTYRTDEIEAHPGLARLERRLSREGAVTSVPLARLSPGAFRELVAHLSGLDPRQAAALADRLFAETSGNPFFLYELVRGLRDSGQIRVEQGQWAGALVESAARAQVPLSHSLRATIAARAERLTEMARGFLQVAAVAGKVFQYDLVKMAGGWSDELALGALENLLARGFLQEGEPAGAFAFAHHLVQEAVYANLTAPRRAYWHRRLAEAMQALRPDDFEVLAHHWAQTGEHDAARAFYVQAGDRAQRLVAMKEAAGHYQAALARWPDADPAGRASALHKLGICQWVTFDTRDALESFGAARVLYEAQGDRVHMGEMERQIGRMYWELGDRSSAVPHFQRALEILEPGPETVELARTLSSISQLHMLASEFDEALAWGERALALAERLGAEDVVVHALNNMGVATVHAGGGDVERGLSMLRESLRRALALGLPHDACRAYLNLSEHVMGLGRYAEARAGLEEMLVYAQRVNARAFVGNAVRRLADLDWLTGAWAEVLGRRASIIEHAWGTWLVWTNTTLSRIDNDLGQPEAARQVLEATLPDALRWGEIQTTVPHLGQLARAYAALGREAQAEDAVRQLLSLSDAHHYIDWDSTMSLLVACRWYAAGPRLEAARACLARLERADAQLHSWETKAALAEGRGLVALAAGDPAEAVRQLDRAAAIWQQAQRPYDQARALGGLAQALSQAGDAAAARAAGDQALAIFDMLAAQIQDKSLRRSFLSSALVRDVRERRAVLEPA